jgi:hypothetical protein
MRISRPPTAGRAARDRQILGDHALRHPDFRIPFKIVNDATPDRLLTGDDFDIETFRTTAARCGSRGVRPSSSTPTRPARCSRRRSRRQMSSRPTPAGLPAPRGRANLASSNGFEGMAISPDGRTLYPTPRARWPATPPLTRRMYQFDIRSRRATSVRRTYHMDNRPSCSPTTALDAHHFVALE